MVGSVEHFLLPLLFHCHKLHISPPPPTMFMSNSLCLLSPMLVFFGLANFGDALRVEPVVTTSDTEVTLTLKIKNISAQPITFDESKNLSAGYEVIVRDEHGKEVTDMRNYFVTSFGSITIQPGNHVDSSIRLDESFDLRPGGRYTVASAKAIAIGGTGYLLRADEVKFVAPSKLLPREVFKVIENNNALARTQSASPDVPVPKEKVKSAEPRSKVNMPVPAGASPPEREISGAAAAIAILVSGLLVIFLFRKFRPRNSW
jgi:hypothetical protein